MKRIYLFLLLIPALLFSCDLLDDANTVDFNTSLAMGIDVSVDDANAIVLKSVTNFAFSESGSASLMSDYELVDYLEKIKSIEVKNLQVTFYGLDAGMVINTINLSVDGVGVIATITNVTSSNATHSPAIDSSKLNQVASILKKNWTITATVNGTTKTAPMWFSIDMVYDLYVEAEAL